jgi:hypothetical protein
MTTLSVMPDAATIKHLRQLIASIISNQKAYNVPGVCSRYGLADGTGEEAFSSKHKYVMQHVQHLPASEVLRVARALQLDEPDAKLGRRSQNLMRNAAHLSPRYPATYRGGTRLVPLSGKLPEIEFLKKLWQIDAMEPPRGSVAAFATSLASGEFTVQRQHL